MNYFQTIILAVVQGLTEFLPVSSSGHLVIFQNLFGLEPPVLFDILVHVGTLGAVIFYFRKKLLKVNRRLLGLIVIGTIPAGLVGLLLQGYLETIFNSLLLVGVSLLITAGLLFSTRWVKGMGRGLRRLSWLDALLVGVFQALAILPGVSRSGATISVGLWRGVKRKTAFRFSFVLAIPAILGAMVLQIPELLVQRTEFLVQGLLGMIIAGLVGFFALKVLERILLKSRFWLFGFYCLGLGLVLLLT